ncbi:MAG: hypothetical protein LBF72_03230 [Holosporales bacterium]|jgi:hypothetical protein|nr:hypothetical protein [Holosporales bacterium]
MKRFLCGTMVFVAAINIANGADERTDSIGSEPTTCIALQSVSSDLDSLDTADSSVQAAKLVVDSTEKSGVGSPAVLALPYVGSDLDPLDAADPIVQAAELEVASTEARSSSEELTSQYEELARRLAEYDARAARNDQEIAQLRTQCKALEEGGKVSKIRRKQKKLKARIAAVERQHSEELAKLAGYNAETVQHTREIAQHNKALEGDGRVSREEFNLAIAERDAEIERLIAEEKRTASFVRTMSVCVLILFCIAALNISNDSFLSGLAAGRERYGKVPLRVR